MALLMLLVIWYFPAGVFPPTHGKGQSGHKGHIARTTAWISQPLAQRLGSTPDVYRHGEKLCSFPCLRHHHDLVPLSPNWKLMRLIATGGPLEQQHNVQQMNISLLQRAVIVKEWMTWVKTCYCKIPLKTLNSQSPSLSDIARHWWYIILISTLFLTLRSDCDFCRCY